jgi:hypothetical protein
MGARGRPGTGAFVHFRKQRYHNRLIHRTKTCDHL